MAEKLLFEAALKDNVSSQSDKIGDSFGSLAKKAGLAALAFVGVEKAMSFLGDAYAEAKEGAIATEKLTAALGKNSKALADQANKLQFRSRFEDDAITSMQAALASYVKSEDAILKLTPAIIDLAEATGVDLKSAAMQVGKAIADDSDEMGRYKIKIDGAAGSNERATSVMQGLTEKFGSQAEAASNAAGQVELLHKSWLGFLQSIGDKITPAIDNLAKHVRESLFPESMDERRSLERRVELAKAAVAQTDRVWRDSNFRKKQYMDEARFDLQVAESILSEYDAISNKQTPKEKITGLTPSDDPEAAKEAAEALIKEQKEAQSAIRKAAEDHVILMEQIRQSGIDNQLAAEKEANDKATAEGDKFRARQLELATIFADDKKKILEKELEEKKRAADFEQRISQAKMNTAVSVGNTLANAAADAIALSKKNGEQTKNDAISMAVIQGVIAHASAAASIWSTVGGSWQEKLAESIAISAALFASQAVEISTINSQKFATGGIVQGPSRGDNVPIRANGGEMVLNHPQQAALFAMANGGLSGGIGGGMVINAGITINGGSAGLTAQDLRRASQRQQQMLYKTMRSMQNNGSMRRLGVAV